MKKKEFSKKLILNKATIVQLKNNHLNSVKGGLPDTSEGIGNPCKTLCNTGFCCLIY